MDNIAIKKMNTIERLQAMEDLWNSILYEGGEINTPEWHKEIIEERKRKIEKGKAEFITIEKLKASHR